MKYLIIDGFSVNDEKNIYIVNGRKCNNDFRTTHGKEVDTIRFNKNLCQIADTCLGKVLNVEWNKSGFIVSAKVE